MWVAAIGEVDEKQVDYLGGLTVLFGLSRAVQQVFRLTHVVRIFRIVQTEQEALGRAPAPPPGGGV